MRNKLISFCMIAWLLAVLPLTAVAQQFDHNEKGSISITLASKNLQQLITGAELSVYYVATVGINTDGNMNYIYTEDFAECGFSLDDPVLAEKLNTYVSTKTLTSQNVITDSLGNASCSNLPLGLYFVKQTGEVEGFAPCTPFLVTLPMKTDSGYQYHVEASPKTDATRLTDLTIKKVWNTGSSSSISSSVTVQLLRGEEIVKTATLNKQNNWQITYTNLPESDVYSIKETDVPEGYTATYSQKGYAFTVTNTPALAQTGQAIWPIPVFALAGIFFMMVGFLILRKPVKHNA